MINFYCRFSGTANTRPVWVFETQLLRFQTNNLVVICFCDHQISFDKIMLWNKSCVRIKVSDCLVSVFHDSSVIQPVTILGFSTAPFLQYDLLKLLAHVAQNKAQYWFACLSPHRRYWLFCGYFQRDLDTTMKWKFGRINPIILAWEPDLAHKALFIKP